MLNPLHSCNISAKIQKNIQKVDYMDGFCWQGELDLTLFYKIEGYFDNLKSLMTGNDRIHEYMYSYTPRGVCS